MTLLSLQNSHVFNTNRKLIDVNPSHADCWANIHLLNTAISFSRLRSLFCFFFTHFMANNFPVFFSFTMNTSENAPLLVNTRTRWVNNDGFDHTDRDKKSPPVRRNESSLLIRIGELLIKYGDSEQH